MSFVKLDTGVLDSTLWLENAETRVVFVTMLAMARPDGLCESTAPGIARRANLPIDEVRASLAKLEAPDPDSRSAENDGRRIMRVDGGFLLTTYKKYRAKDHIKRDEGAPRQYVYFASNQGGHIKIGFSSNPWARVRELSTGGGPLRLLAVQSGSRQDEAALHLRFSALRKHGEWFEPGQELLTCINDVALRSSDVVPEAEAEADAEEKKKKRAKARKTPIPDGFGISPRIEAWAAEHGHGLLQERLEHFVGYAKRSGKTYADWDAAFECAVREDWAKLNGGAAPSRAGTLGAEETT